jgi:hypothetical protein
MDVHIHHSIELSGPAVWALIIVLAVIAVCLLYPMVVPPPALPPDPPKGPLGFR